MRLTMRLFSLLLACGLLVAACSPGPDPFTPEADAQPPATTPEAAETWQGRWTFGEAWPGSGEITNVMDYALVMGRFEGALQGSVGVYGYQTSSEYEVRGVLRGDTLDIIVSGYGEDDMGRRVEIGERLFSLVASGDGHVTVWDALTPVLSEDEAGNAFEREEMD